MPLGVAVFLVMGGLLASSAFINKNGSLGGNGVLGGVAIVSSAYGAQPSRAGGDLAMVNTQNSSFLASLSYGNGNDGNYITQEESASFNNDEGLVRDSGGVFSEQTNQSGIVNYTVQQGDTLPSIAAYFGVSVDTIMSANSKTKSEAVVPGAILKILPVSGVLYISRKGDTLQSVASSFNVQADQIVNANPSVNLDPNPPLNISFINPGTSLIIPGGKSALTTSPSVGS
ncbi:MAG: LysM peptidoglycan-binding domain-containing protein [Candidatus Pacebacteria bacterium]|nr:LysM peptidoglycan-binding domain-containing protein [Candidatus Paceibacterota bacterium]